MKKLIPFLIIFILVFYGLPLIIKASVFVFMLSPILILLTGLVYGIKYGFSIIFSLLCAILFIPMLMTYGLIAFVYVIGFFIVSLIGNLLGLFFHKKM